MASSTTLNPPPPDCLPDRKVIYFDVDNTLYSKKVGVGKLMQDYIRKYFQEELGLDEEEAERKHLSYYEEYGLALEGLVRRNKVDAMDYNSRVDDALPLEECLKPDHSLQELLSKIDRRKWKLWICTNAFINHGLRVVRLLGVDHFFEGISYCNYRNLPLICKPMRGFFDCCMASVNVQPDSCYFIDDSLRNVEAANQLGWRAVHFDEDYSDNSPRDHVLKVTTIHDLPKVWPEVFE